MIECEKENNYAFKNGYCDANAFHFIGILSIGLDSYIKSEFDRRK